MYIILMTNKFLYRRNCQEWNENEQEVDSPYHLSGDPYFPTPHVERMLILIDDSEPEEDPSEDPEEMEQDPDEDPREDPEEMEHEPEEETKSEAYESVGDLTLIKAEPVASRPPISYYLGSRIPRNWKHAHKTISMCGGIKKKPRMRVPRFQSLTGNFHPYHIAPVKPTWNLVPQVSRET